MATKAYEKELEKKLKRRKNDLDKVFEFDLSTFVGTKKPKEHHFDKDQAESFLYPILIGNTVYEIKRDGYGVHIIILEKGNLEAVKLFSLDGNEWNVYCFPELHNDLLKRSSGYYHGEVIGLRPEGIERFTNLEEYNAVQLRPKISTKNITPELLRDYPLRLEIFDALKIDGKSLLFTPLKERRVLLESEIGESKHLGLVKQWVITDYHELHQLFLQIINDGFEGLIAKDPDSFYIPGSRDTDWLKIKEFLTLDLAVLGFYETEVSIKNDQPFSALLMGSYNSQTHKFETIVKVKVSKKEDQDEIYEKLKDFLVVTGGNYEQVVKAVRNMVVNPNMRKIQKKIPVKIINYKGGDRIVILELQTQNITFSDNWHSCGFDEKTKKAHSLRIPSFKQIRDDKTRVEDVTTTQQIQDYYFET